MGHTMLKTTLAFGLVAVPVKVSVAARSKGVSFHLLHEACGKRIKQKTYCEHCDEEITRADTVKGYELDKDEYLRFTPEELEAAQTKSNKTMEILSSVDAQEIDPMLFDASYYLEPDGAAGLKGYWLIYSALLRSRKYAIARMTMSQREHIVIVRPYRGCLAFHTMYFADEIEAPPVIQDEPLRPKELDLACQLIAAQAEPFEHGRYRDGYTDAIQQMIDDKQRGRKVKAMPPRREPGATPDIQEALVRSLKIDAGIRASIPAKKQPRRSA